MIRGPMVGNRWRKWDDLVGWRKWDDLVWRREAKGGFDNSLQAPKKDGRRPSFLLKGTGDGAMVLNRDI